MGRFLKEHGDVPALERPARPARRLFDPVRQVENLAQLASIEVRNVQEVTAQESFHRSDHDRSPGD
jgi:hypothetical protein